MDSMDEMDNAMNEGAPDWAAGVTRLDQYLGVWAMMPAVLMEVAGVVSRWDMGAHVRQSLAMGPRAPKGPVYTVTDGVAVLELNGMMTKYGSSIGEGVSSLEMRRAVRMAGRDPEVRAVMVRIDSPGGSTRGLSDLVDELEAVGRVKPTAAYIEDLGASAAFMVSAVAGRVSANASAWVGSIGTYAVLYDQSALFAKEGIRPIVVRAGDMKGIGLPGTEITPEQVAELQRMVVFTNGFFLGAVERGRGLSGERLTAVADGRMWGAAEAAELGLIDAVETFDAAFSNLAARAAQSKKGVGTMNGPTGQPRTAATLQELRTVCVGADDSFLLSQLGSGATIEEAGRAWITRQAELLTEARAQAAAAASRPGVPPVPSGGRAGGPAHSARQELEALVQTRMQSTGEPRHKAWATVMARNEDLRQRMVEEENAAAR